MSGRRDRDGTARADRDFSGGRIHAVALSSSRDEEQVANTLKPTVSHVTEIVAQRIIPPLTPTPPR
jgi:hypothetical protein